MQWSEAKTWTYQRKEVASEMIEDGARGTLGSNKRETLVDIT